MATASQRAAVLFLFRSVLWPPSWLLRRQNLGTSALICRLPTESPMAPSGQLKLAVLNYVNCIFLARYEIKHGGAAARTIRGALV